MRRERMYTKWFVGLLRGITGSVKFDDETPKRSLLIAALCGKDHAVLNGNALADPLIAAILSNDDRVHVTRHDDEAVRISWNRG